MAEKPEPHSLAERRAYYRHLLRALGWAVAGVAVGWAVRYAAIEPEAIGRACRAGAASWGCGLRQILISLFHMGFFGAVGTVAGLYAVFGRRGPKRAAALALVAGGLALALYNAGLGSVAVGLGLLSAMKPDGE